MSRDYKNINKQARQAEKKSSALVSHLFTFITGLCIGGFVATFILIQPDMSWMHFNSKKSVKDPVRNEQQAQNSKQKKARSSSKPKMPKVNFEFYDILRKRKLNITERIASEQEEKSAKSNANDVYLLQVGSFRKYKTADTLKAKLALIGITSYISRTVLNGQDSRYRVRVGPFDNSDKLRLTSQRLKDNNYQYMLVKLELENSQGTGVKGG